MYAEDRDALADEYINVGAAVPDRVAVNLDAACFHRPARGTDDVEPACSTTHGRYAVVAPDEAREAGAAACRRCFAAVLEHLARQPDSPVERRGADAAIPRVGDLDAEAIADGSGGVASRPTAPLTARTETVRIKGSPSQVYHAPASNGTLCGRRGAGYRSVRVEAVEGHFQPCEECFDLASDE